MTAEAFQSILLLIANALLGVIVYIFLTFKSDIRMALDKQEEETAALEAKVDRHIADYRIHRVT